jgi:hypothetical protein
MISKIYQKKAHIALIAVLCLGFLLSCGKDEDPEAIKSLRVFVFQDVKSKVYKLEIPNKYRPHEFEGQISLLTAFPGMIGYSPEMRHRFFNENNTYAADQVDIRLKMLRIFSKDGKVIGDQNDLGASIKRNYMSKPRYKEIPLIQNFKEPKKITRYVTPADTNTDFRSYVITHEDRRVSFVSCIIRDACKGKTTWKGDFGITYLISRKHLDNIVDLDRSVIALIEKFKPKLIIEEK